MGALCSASSHSSGSPGRGLRAAGPSLSRIRVSAAWRSKPPPSSPVLARGRVVELDPFSGGPYSPVVDPVERVGLAGAGDHAGDVAVEQGGAGRERRVLRLGSQHAGDQIFADVGVDLGRDHVLLQHAQLALDLGGELLAHVATQVAARVVGHVFAQEAAQRRGDLGRGLVAVGARASQAAVGDRLELGRHPGDQLADRPVLGVADLDQQIHLVGGGERRQAGQHLVQARAEREDVRAVVELAAQGLLGAHVLDLALDDAGLGVDLGQRRLGDAEVAQLDLAGVRADDVGRRDVAVDDAQRPPPVIHGGVRGVQGGGDLGGHVGGVLTRHRPLALAAALEDRPQILAVHVLHGDEVLAVGAGELVDAGDVGVAQEAGDLGLVDQHLDEVVVLGQVSQDPFDRHQVGVATGIEGLGAVDLGHTPESNAVHQVVPTQLLSPPHDFRVYSKPLENDRSTSNEII